MAGESATKARPSLVRLPSIVEKTRSSFTGHKEKPRKQSVNNKTNSLNGCDNVVKKRRSTEGYVRIVCAFCSRVIQKGEHWGAATQFFAVSSLQHERRF